MKTPVLTAFAVLLATAAHAQTAPQTTPQPAPAGSDFTRDLNSGPPAATTYLAPAPTPAPATTAPQPATAPRTSAPTPTPSPSPTVTRPPATTPAPAASAPVTTQPPRASAPATSGPAVTPPRTAAPTPAPATVTPRPVTPTPTPAPSPATSAPAPAAFAPAPVVATPPPPPPNVSTVTVLDAAARAALPFSIEVPQGFEMVTGRPGPNFRIYTVRRRSDERSFVMIYTGPNSQFPIYSGEVVQAGGRSSVVATQDGARHAVEHLFERQVEPLEVHIWTMSFEGADQALAEQIAQSADVR